MEYGAGTGPDLGSAGEMSGAEPGVRHRPGFGVEKFKLTVLQGFYIFYGQSV